MDDLDSFVGPVPKAPPTTRSPSRHQFDIMQEDDDEAFCVEERLVKSRGPVTTGVIGRSVGRSSSA